MKDSRVTCVQFKNGERLAICHDVSFNPFSDGVSGFSDVSGSAVLCNECVARVERNVPLPGPLRDKLLAWGINPVSMPIPKNEDGLP